MWDLDSCLYVLFVCMCVCWIDRMGARSCVVTDRYDDVRILANLHRSISLNPTLPASVIVVVSRKKPTKKQRNNQGFVVNDLFVVFCCCVLMCVCYRGLWTGLIFLMSMRTHSPAENLLHPHSHVLHCQHPHQHLHPYLHHFL